MMRLRMHWIKCGPRLCRGNIFGRLLSETGCDIILETPGDRPGNFPIGQKKMNRMLGVALAAGLALSSGAAYALDKVGGTVSSVDIVYGEFTLAVDGDASRAMQFRVAPEIDFDNLSLTKGQTLDVEYDAAACAGKADCVPVAKAVTIIRKKKG